MFAVWQVGKLFKKLRAQRLGNGMFGVEPFAEVHQLAALGTKRSELSSEPAAGFFARRAFILPPSFIWFRLQSS